MSPLLTFWFAGDDFSLKIWSKRDPLYILSPEWRDFSQKKGSLSCGYAKSFE